MSNIFKKSILELQKEKEEKFSRLSIEEQEYQKLLEFVMKDQLKDLEKKFENYLMYGTVEVNSEKED